MHSCNNIGITLMAIELPLLGFIENTFAVYTRGGHWAARFQVHVASEHFDMAGVCFIKQPLICEPHNAVEDACFFCIALVAT